jgi:hypothetical protein
MRFDPSLPRGYSKRVLRYARKRWSLNGLVDVHHVVPKQFKHHPVVLEHGYDVEADYNFMFCVTKRGVQRLNIRDSRPIHDIHHSRYNLFVKEQLDSTYDYSSLLAVLFTLYHVCKGRTSSRWSTS